MQPTTFKEKILLEADINSDSPIKSISIILNDKAQGIIPNGKSEYKISEELALTPGSNNVSISVSNESGDTITEPKKVYYVNEKRLALVIGNSKYEQKEYALDRPMNDAKDMAEKLESSSLGFEVITCYDANLGSARFCVGRR